MGQIHHGAAACCPRSLAWRSFDIRFKTEVSFLVIFRSRLEPPEGGSASLRGKVRELGPSRCYPGNGTRNGVRHLVGVAAWAGYRGQYEGWYRLASGVPVLCLAAFAGADGKARPSIPAYPAPRPKPDMARRSSLQRNNCPNASCEFIRYRCLACFGQSLTRNLGEHPLDDVASHAGADIADAPAFNTVSRPQMPPPSCRK